MNKLTYSNSLMTLNKIKKFYNDKPKHLSPNHFIETLEYQISIY